MDNKAGRVFKTLLSVILAVIIFILGFSMEGIMALRAGTTPDRVTEIADEIDWANVRVGFLKGKDDSTTWAQAIADGLPLGIGGYGFTDKAEDLLGRNFFRNYMSEKLNLFVDDFYHKTGDGVIRSSELARLLKDNADVCRTVFGVDVNDAVLSALVDAMVGGRSEVIFSVDELRNSNPRFFKSARFFCSYFFVVLLGALLLVGAVLIFLLQKQGHKALKYVTWDLGLIGGAIVIFGLVTGTLAGTMNRMVGLGTDFYKILLGPMKSNLLKYGLYTLVAMLIVAILNKLCAVVVVKRSEGEINIKVSGDTGKGPAKGTGGLNAANAAKAAKESKGSKGSKGSKESKKSKKSKGSKGLLGAGFAPAGLPDSDMATTTDVASDSDKTDCVKGDKPAKSEEADGINVN